MTQVVWEGVYKNFFEASVVGKGFSGRDWVANSRQRALTMHNADQSPSTVKPVPNLHAGWLPALAGLVAASKGSVNILDFGGGLGFAYLPVRAALPRPEGLTYRVVETTPVCEEGRRFFAGDPWLEFSPSLPQQMDNLDIVHLGSALHYIENWADLLAELAALYPKYLSIVDLPAGDIPTFASRQHYYGSLIPCWFFNLNEVTAAVERFGFTLAARIGHHSSILGRTTLPVDNFPEELRLPHTCDLLFIRAMP